MVQVHVKHALRRGRVHGGAATDVRQVLVVFLRGLRALGLSLVAQASLFTLLSLLLEKRLLLFDLINLLEKLMVAFAHLFLLLLRLEHLLEFL